MKHAFLIEAHNNWEQLKILIGMLDSSQHDIYVHIDLRSKNVPLTELERCSKYSKIVIHQKYKVFWGGYSQVQVELFLLEMAAKEKYDYGEFTTNTYIDKFFEINNGYEFVSFCQINPEIKRRTALYHFLQNYRRRYHNNILNNFFVFLERILLMLQTILKIDRMRKYPNLDIKYGSNWVSITNAAAQYILNKRKLVENIFKYTNCADELFIHTLLWNSEFKGYLFEREGLESNLRLTDWVRGEHGSPYTFKKDDFDMIISSNCLFARKFNISEDKEIIDMVCKKYTMGESDDFRNSGNP